MKKIVFIFVLVLSLFLGGCDQIGVHIKFDDLSSINKIEITEYDVSDGNIINYITLNDMEVINSISDNFTSLEIKKIFDTNVPTDINIVIKYNFTFFSVDDKVKIIGITANNWIEYQDHFYSIEQGVIDFNYIDNLFEKRYALTIHKDNDYILQGIKENYKAGEEVEVKMIYEEEIITYVFLNSELLGTLNDANSVKFNMPEKDSTLVLTHTNQPLYKVSVIDNFDLLLVPLKEYYYIGETVKVVTKFLSGARIDAQVDEHILEVKESEAYVYYGYEFIMPAKDVELIILYNGFCIPEDNNLNNDDVENIDGTYTVELIANLNYNSNEVKSLIIKEDVLYLASDDKEYKKIGIFKHFEDEMKLSQIINREKLSFKNEESEKIVQKLLTKDCAYSIAIVAIPEFAPGYILIELDNQLYYIYMESNISEINSIAIFKLNE